MAGNYISDDVSLLKMGFLQELRKMFCVVPNIATLNFEVVAILHSYAMSVITDCWQVRLKIIKSVISK